MKFKDFNLNPDILSALKKAGYETPSPIQEQAIPLVMEGKDLIACAQTGTGKTAAFALPVLNAIEPLKHPKIRALVLTPTRELAMQIFENSKKYGRYLKIRIACVYGGAKRGPQEMALRKGCDVLIATPGRLMDYMNQGIVDLRNVEFFILDEADRMLDMGFIPDVKRIVPCMPKERQTVMFSATMPKEIEALAKEFLKDPVTIKIAATTDPADTVDQKIIFTAKENKTAVLVDLLRQPEVKKSIIFTRTKYGADKLVKQLAKEKIEARAIHGDKTQGQRLDALQRFRSGNIKILVATDVASRGIDVPKITHVFNYELPEEDESYIHRIGRTGRAGETGMAISLCCEEEMGTLASIEKMMGKEIPEMKTEYSIVIPRQKPAKHKPVKHKSVKHKNGGSSYSAKNNNKKRSANKPQRAAGKTESRNFEKKKRSANKPQTAGKNQGKKNVGRNSGKRREN